MPSRLARTLGAAILTLALLACPTPPASASDDAPAAEVGRLAPELRVQDLINAPDGMTAENLNWESLRGKVVVLEFWATWCGPCIAAIPHLNELTEEFAGEDVVFIAVTDERRDVVERFLERRPIHGIVAMNTERNMLRDYGVRYIPYTVVVDRYGRIADITSPRLLTAERIHRYMTGWRATPTATPAAANAGAKAQGQELEAPQSVSPGFDPYTPNQARPVFQVIFRESPTKGGGMSGSAGHDLAVISASRRALLERLFFTGPGQLDLSELGKDDEKRYDLIVRHTPQSHQSNISEILQSVVLEHLGAEATREQRAIPAFTLTLDPAGHKLGEPDAENEFTGTSYRHSGENITMTGVTMDALASAVGRWIDSPIDNNTDIAGRFEISLDIERGYSPEELAKAFREQLGLRLEAKTVDREVVILRPTSKQAAAD